MEYSITNLAADNIGENVYVKAFVVGTEMEQREKMPLVSVLLASYNHEKFVEASIRSIMEQKGVNFELIVIDDGSTDKSPQILENLQGELKFIYLHRPNKGLVATMNELLSMAKGKYFCSFASDDIMPPDRLRKQCAYLESHPDKVACFGQIIPMSESGIIGKTKDPRFMKSVPSITFEELFLAKKSLHGCSEMFNREKIVDIGGYDTRYRFEDYPLYLKILQKYGSQPVLPDLICCYYREAEGSMHSQTDKMYTEFMKIIDGYSKHVLYSQAKKIWKSNWFSALAYEDKWAAIKAMPKLSSFSWSFVKRLPKLFMPQRLLKY